MEGYSQNNSQF